MDRTPRLPVTSWSRRSLGALSCVALVTAAACGQATPMAPTAPTSAASLAASATEAKKTSGISMDVSQWTFRFSPGPNPTLSPSGGGWQFTFPHEDGVHYLTTDQNPPRGAGMITASIEVDTTNAPTFFYQTEPGNTCPSPAMVHLFFQRTGDNLSGVGKFAFYRWWSTANPYTLADGSATLTGNLSDLSHWTSVNGEAATGHAREFSDAFAHVGAIGFTFGGGCFFGHGVYVTPPGSDAVFKTTSFVVQ